MTPQPDRLAELRDLLATSALDADQRRQQKLDLVPTARAAKATTVEIAAAFGISRAAFYKNDYSKIAASTATPTLDKDTLLSQISALNAANDAEQISAWRQERDALILEELAKPDSRWAAVQQRAGVTAPWLERLQNRE